jgi:hypothetical protein
MNGRDGAARGGSPVDFLPSGRDSVGRFPTTQPHTVPESGGRVGPRRQLSGERGQGTGTTAQEDAR